MNMLVETHQYPLAVTEKDLKKKNGKLWEMENNKFEQQTSRFRESALSIVFCWCRNWSGTDSNFACGFRCPPKFPLIFGEVVTL